MFKYKPVKSLTLIKHNQIYFFDLSNQIATGCQLWLINHLRKSNV